MKKDKNEDKIFYDYLDNLNIPIGDNKSHREKLWDELEKESLLFDKLQVKKDKSSIFIPFKPVLRYSFYFALFFIIIFSGIFLFFRFYVSSSHRAFVIPKNGNLYINSKILLKDKTKIKMNDLLKTDMKSDASIKIGETSVFLEELTEIKLIKLNKHKNDTNTRLYLNDGKILCNVKLMTKKSIFEIKTDLSLFSVKGTKFMIQILDNKDVILDVTEGVVEVSEYIAKPFLSGNVTKMNNENVGLLNKIINKKISVKSGNKIILSNKIINDFNNDMILLIKEINENPINNEIINNRLIAFENKSNQLFIINENNNENLDVAEEKKLLKIEKLSGNPGILLEEKNTSISSDNESIYILSDSNNKLYCISAKNGKIKWEINKPDINTTFTQEVIAFENELLFATPVNMFILNKNGSIKSKMKIEEGPEYWADPLIINKKVFIPGIQNIFIYDGSSIKKLKNINGMGQLFITYYRNELFFTDLNLKNITRYDLNDENIIGSFSELKNRAFMPPVVTDKYIFIADISGNIYKYDKNDKKQDPKIIKAGIEIITGLIYNDNKIYFIASNGYFYSLNIEKFNKPEKIIKIDYIRDRDKYLTKKFLKINKKIFFCSDTGSLFFYNIINGKGELLDISENPDNFPLIGTPVYINNSIYVVDNRANIYKLLIN